MKTDTENALFIANNFDPFKDIPSKKVEEILKDLGLYKYLDNPYRFTNELLLHIHPESNEGNKNLQ